MPDDTRNGAADIAVVIPHFQRQKGLLAAAVRSVFQQTLHDRVTVVIGDDSSPVAAEEEIRALPDVPQHQVIILRRPNGGAGAARNSALDALPGTTRFVAYLDSDDTWRPRHLENAIHALELGYDAYFSNFIGVGYPDVSHFDRIGTLLPQDHPVIDASRRMHALSVSALEHTVSDGGGLIGTPTVVYRHHKYPSLRFREEFFNGQDFFFWMDLSELGAKFAFSYEVECDAGTGVNIYQASGWGTEKSQQRMRNELFVWTSVERFYKLTPALLAANRRTIRELQESLGQDLLFRLKRNKSISPQLLMDVVRMAPSSLYVVPASIIKTVLSRVVR